MNTHLRPGWRTSEFWITTLTIVGLVFASVVASLSPHAAAYAAGVSAAAYSIARGLSKMFPPKDAP